MIELTRRSAPQIITTTRDTYESNTMSSEAPKPQRKQLEKVLTGNVERTINSGSADSKPTRRNAWKLRILGSLKLTIVPEPVPSTTAIQRANSV